MSEPYVRTVADAPVWIVRPSRPGDESQLAALFTAVFGQPLTEAQWRWKLCTQPAPAPNSWVAEAGERIVGHYGGMPMRYRLGGREVLAMHGCNAMTAADFRRQGILTAVHGRANEVWKQAGIPFQTGLHYGGWGSRREFLGWVPLFKLVWVNHPLRPFRRAARRLGAPSGPLRFADALWRRLWNRRLAMDSGDPRAASVTIREVAAAGPAFDALWAAAGPGYENVAVRDRAWVAWRYLAAPGYGYRVLLAERGGAPAGYLVYRVEHTAASSPTGWIADLFAVPAATTVRRALLRRALDGLHAAGAESAVALVPAGALLHHELRRAGFLFGRATYDFSIVPFDPALPLDTLRDPARWFLTGADFDVV